MALHEELREIGDPILRKVQDHPFWSALRDGSLPGAALTYFVEQDTGFLLPAYARALARCAAVAVDDEDTWLLAMSASATLEARDRLRSAYAGLQEQLGVPPLGDRPPVGPGTHAHASFFAAASTTFHGGIAALFPMVWFNAEVTDELKDKASPGSRYLPWIEAYHPGESYRPAVQGFIDMIDRAGENCSARQRQLIVEQFSTSIRYEWEFAACCLRQASWPV